MKPRILHAAFILALILAGAQLVYAPALNTNYRIRQMVARVYDADEIGAGFYEGVIVELNYNSFKIPAENFKTGRFVMVLAEDQDAELREIFSNSFYCWKLGENPQEEYSFHLFDSASTHKYRLLDALGAPISNFSVLAIKPYLQDEQQELDYKLTNAQITDGILQLPISNVSMSCALDLADYGCARIELHSLLMDLDQTKTIQLPVVRRDADVYARAARGVVYAGGAPLAHAAIQCHAIRTPGGGIIQNWSDQNAMALSGANGDFAIYLPHKDATAIYAKTLVSPESEERTPPNSVYEIAVYPPQGSGFLPGVARVLNNEPTSITLQSQSVGRFHTFHVFAADGTELPRERVGYSQLSMRVFGADKNRSGDYNLTRGEILNGCYLPAGKLIARYEQETQIDIDESTPEAVEIRPNPQTAYQGRIVHGVTGEPLSDAFIAAYNGTINEGVKLADLTDADWQALNAWDSSEGLESEKLRALTSKLSISGFARSYYSGDFELNTPVGGDVHSLLLFKRGFVGYVKYGYNLKKISGQRFDVAQIPLFPAAQIRIRFELQDKAELASIAGAEQFYYFGDDQTQVSPNMEFDTENLPKWAQFLAQRDFNSNGHLEPGYDWRSVERELVIDVPANVQLKALRFDCSRDFFADWGIERPRLLQAGETLDLGEQTLARCLRIPVRIVDSQGLPVEGIPVRPKIGHNRGWQVAKNSNPQGLVEFWAAPRAELGCGVLYLRPGDSGGRHQLKEFKFEVDLAPPHEPFQITLGEELIAQINQYSAKSEY